MNQRYFCPFCGAKDEHLTYSSYTDKLIEKEVTDAFCNACKRGYLVILMESWGMKLEEKKPDEG